MVSLQISTLLWFLLRKECVETSDFAEVLWNYYQSTMSHFVALLLAKIFVAWKK